MSETPHTHRRIRSFVRREGRMTVAQAQALETLSAKYGIAANEGVFNFDTLFGRRAPLYIEIGFGMGDTLAEMAQLRPHDDFIGIEVHRPGVGSLLRKLTALNIANVRVVSMDAVEILRDKIPDGTLAGINIFFPDPWPKKRHHKRRLVQPEFVALLCNKLAIDGKLHLATDWENYAEYMLHVADALPGLKNDSGVGKYSTIRDRRPITKFERRGLKLGHGVWDLIYTRIV